MVWQWDWTSPGLTYRSTLIRREGLVSRTVVPTGCRPFAFPRLADWLVHHRKVRPGCLTLTCLILWSRIGCRRRPHRRPSVPVHCRRPSVQLHCRRPSVQLHCRTFVQDSVVAPERRVVRFARLADSIAGRIQTGCRLAPAAIGLGFCFQFGRDSDFVLRSRRQFGTRSFGLGRLDCRRTHLEPAEYRPLGYWRPAALSTHQFVPCFVSPPLYLGPRHWGRLVPLPCSLVPFRRSRFRVAR